VSSGCRRDGWCADEGWLAALVRMPYLSSGCA
jgi:hypothetical protein